MSSLILLSGSGGTSGSNGIFAQTEGSTPIIGNLGGTLIGPGVGSLTFAANTLNIGDSFEYSASGTISSLNNENFILSVSLGVITLVTTTHTLPNLAGSIWTVNAKFTIQTIDGASKVAASIQFYVVRAGTLHYSHNVATVNTLNTTISNTFDIRAAFATNNPTNEISSITGVLTKTY